MKLRHLLTAAVILATTTGMAFAQERGAGGEGGGRPGRGGPGGGGPGGGPGGGFMRQATGENLYGEITKAVPSLTEDQKATLKTKTDAMVKELQAFSEETRKKFEEMRNNGGGGQGGGGGFEQLRKIGEDRQKIVSENMTKVMDVLTPEQRAEWESFRLARDINGRLARLDATEDQKAKVAEVVKEAAKTIAGLKPNDQKAVAEANGKAWKAVIDKVLTDEQVGKLLAAGGPLGGQFPGGPGGLMGNVGRGQGGPGAGGGDGGGSRGNRGQRGGGGGGGVGARGGNRG